MDSAAEYYQEWTKQEDGGWKREWKKTEKTRVTEYDACY